MNNYRRHYSVVLAFLLIFPLVFQAVHVFHDHGLRTDNIEFENNTHPTIELHVEFDDCLICDFEYVVFLDEQQIHSSSKLDFFAFDLPLGTTDIPFQFDGFIPHLRGPPADL